jgi:hypothetical protein
MQLTEYFSTLFNTFLQDKMRQFSKNKILDLIVLYSEYGDVKV